MPYKDPAKRREYARRWMAARRAEWFDGKVCADCGGTERLEVDHVDPADKVSHKVWSWSAERRAAELAKCVPRCHDCHLAKSLREGDLGSDDCRGVTFEQASRIRERYATGEVTQAALAAEYGIGRSTVGDIVRGTTRNVA